MRLYLAIVFLLYVSVNAQNIAIYGHFKYLFIIIIIIIIFFYLLFSTYLTAFDQREIAQIYGQCFNGIILVYIFLIIIVDQD